MLTEEARRARRQPLQRHSAPFRSPEHRSPPRWAYTAVILFCFRGAVGHPASSRSPRKGSAWSPFLTDGGNNPKVLIADDERIIADTLRLILAQKGFDACAVYDGRCAVDKARGWHPDIFLTDVVMPVLNGIEAAVLITRMLPACHVLLLSGNAEGLDLWHEAYVQGHAFPMLQKPVPPEALIAHLWETFLERSRDAS